MVRDKSAVEVYDDDYGEKWFSDEASFQDDLVPVWGRRWSVSSEVGRLRACLVRRPGKEIECVKNPADWRWGDVMDPQKARDQHDAFTQVYRDHGVDVFYVHVDHLNTPRVVTQPSNNAERWRWDSDAFGTNPPNEDAYGDGSTTASSTKSATLPRWLRSTKAR